MALLAKSVGAELEEEVRSKRASWPVERRTARSSGLSDGLGKRSVAGDGRLYVDRGVCSTGEEKEVSSKQDGRCGKMEEETDGVALHERLEAVNTNRAIVEHRNKIQLGISESEEMHIGCRLYSDLIPSCKPGCLVSLKRAFHISRRSQSKF